VVGFSGASGAIILTIAPPPRPPNDNFADRILLSGPTVTTNGINFEATSEEGEPNHAGGFGGKSVWWSWAAPFAGTAVITTVGSDIDTVLAVYSGDAVDDLTFIAANDQDPLGGSTSRITFNARAGFRYEIAVDGWNADSGEIVLNVEMPPAPPTLSQARPLTNGTFQVTLFGAAGRTYIIESKTNVTAAVWSPIATNMASPLGVWIFTDSASSDLPRRFYRARLRE
jgi:hypothetical protein